MIRIHMMLAFVILACASRSVAGDRLAMRTDERIAVGDMPVFECDAPDQSLLANWSGYVRGEVPIRKSMSINYGLSYDPNNDNDMLLVSFQWTSRYKDFWLHDAPDSLMMRFEVAGGARLMNETRGVFSCGMFAQRYITPWSTDTFKPYVDAGVGIIYTDFQNKKQGLRVNFNPRFSVGTDLVLGGSTYFVALRLFHVSNAELHEDNRGINGGMVVMGRYF